MLEAPVDGLVDDDEELELEGGVEAGGVLGDDEELLLAGGVAEVDGPFLLES